MMHIGNGFDLHLAHVVFSIVRRIICSQNCSLFICFYAPLKEKKLNACFTWFISLSKIKNNKTEACGDIRASHTTKELFLLLEKKHGYQIQVQFLNSIKILFSLRFVLISLMHFVYCWKVCHLLVMQCGLVYLMERFALPSLRTSF